MAKASSRLNLVKKFMVDNAMSHDEMNVYVRIIGLECDAQDTVNDPEAFKMGLISARSNPYVLEPQHDRLHKRSK
jgi:hypothetical protein